MDPEAFAEPLELVIQGKTADAAAKLAGAIASLFGGPLAGAAASGLVHRMATLFTDTATKRFVGAGKQWDDETEQRHALGAYFTEIVAPAFVELNAELTRLAEKQRQEFLKSRELQDEYFERTLRFIHRALDERVASREGQAKTHALLREVLGVLGADLRDAGSPLPILFEGPGRVPAKPVPFFSAPEELDALCELLRGENQAVCVVAHGMGGVGKTVLAHELVARRAPELFVAGAAWIDARALALDLPRVARRFGWNKDRDATIEEACAHLCNALYDQKVLLVVDNVDPAVQDLATLPLPGGKARTLITSRDVNLAGTLGARVTSAALELDRWSVERCRHYLEQAAPEFERETDADLDALASFVGGLALAMHLIAGQPRRRRGLRAPELLAELKAAPLGTLDRFVDQHANGIERGVVQTFVASLHALSEAELRALRALAVCADGTRREIVAAVAGLELEPARTALDHLADISLAEYTGDRAETPWGLHDVIRLLVREQQDVMPFETAHRAWLDAHLTAHADPTDYAAFDVAVPEGLAVVERLVERGNITEAHDVFHPLFVHLLRRGDYARVIASGSRLLEAAKDDAMRAVWLGNLGLCYRTLGDIPNAIQHLQRSLVIDVKLGRLEGQAAGLGNLGLCYQTLGDIANAIDHHQRSLALSEKLGRLDGQAADLGNLGICYRTLGDIPEAIKHHRRSLDIDVKLGHLEGQASQLGNLGLCYRTLGDIPKAIQHHERSLSLNEKLGRLEGQAAGLGNLGLCYQTLGDIPKAIDHLQRSLDIDVKLGSLEGQASQLGNLGICYRTLGDIPKAIQHHERSLSLNEKLGRLEGQAAGLGNLGLCYQTLGDIPKAIDHLQRSLDIDVKLGRLEGQANQLGNLGLCYRTLGDIPKAIDYHQRSLSLNVKLGRLEGQAAALGNLGLCYQTLGDIPKAIDHLQRSLDIDVKLGSLEGQANQLAGLGLCYWTLGDIPKAIDHHERSLDINVKLGSLEGQANQLYNLGGIYAEQGKRAEARKALSRSLELYRKMSLAEDHPNVVKARTALEALGE